MKWMRVEQTGGPEALRFEDAAVPTPAAGEVLIKLVASGVNYIDTHLRAGRYAAKLPYTPGVEGAGTVHALGDGVTSFKVGDRVAWCTLPGTYAEFAVAPAARVVPIPDAVSFEQAAAALLQGMTAHALTHSTYPIAPGDEVLIHAGAGGMGLLLTQMARARGARVITTVSTEEKAALSREAGADAAILYTRDDFEVEVRRLTEGRGVAVVYDAIGKTTFEQSLRSLKMRGMLALYGQAGGMVPPFDIERLNGLGSLYVTRPLLAHYVHRRDELLWRAGEVLNAVADGSLTLRMEHTYPLADASQAHRDLESRGTTGKLLLVM